MDGLTPVKQRRTLMDELNDSPDIFIFILTIKVGGMVKNLTGANRVIIIDPDWKPLTNMQVWLFFFLCFVLGCKMDGLVGIGNGSKQVLNGSGHL
jgi:hypothetical protein